MKQICLFLTLYLFIQFAHGSIEYRHLKIVQVYETLVENLPSTYGKNLKVHIEMLKRIRVPVEIERHNFEEVMCSVLRTNATTCEHPIGVFLGGGTASGKSSITKQWLPIFNNQTCGYVHIDPDAIMMEMPEWKILTNDSSLAECASTELHTNSSAVALKCYEESLRQNMSVVYDGTMSTFDKTVRQINEASARGYELHMFGVTVNIDVAAERSWNRAEITKRYVPLCAIWSTHVGYSQFYPNYTNLIRINQLYDNDGDKPYMIAQNNVVINKTLYWEFLDKSKETYGDVEKNVNLTILTDYNQLNKLCGTCPSSVGVKGITSQLTMIILACFVIYH